MRNISTTFPKETRSSPRSLPMYVSTAGRWDTTAGVKRVMGVEIRKAISGLATGRAPGPDGFPAEVSRILPAATELVAKMFTNILTTGRFPGDLLRVFVMPLGKPAKPQTLCSSKRPISLIMVLSKSLEAVVLRRISPLVEDRLHGSQYAYRRARGTEMHLLELSDFISERSAEGCLVYLMSLGIEGAFDAVPHHMLV